MNLLVLIFLTFLSSNGEIPLLKFPTALPCVTEFSEIWEGYCSFKYNGFFKAESQRLNPMTLPYQFSTVSSFCFTVITLVTSFFSQSCVLYYCFCFPSFFPHDFFSGLVVFFWCGLIFFIIGDTCNFSQKNSIMSIALLMGRNILNAELQEKSWTRFILCIVYNPELMFDIAGSWASQLPVLEPICSALCSTLCTATGWDEWMTSSFQATRFCHSVFCYCNVLTL